MKQIFRNFSSVVLLVAGLSLGLPALALEVDELVGTWNMKYNNGQGDQTGTIMVSKNADGSAKIVMTTTGGGNSEARNIAISGDNLSFARDINIQGQSLTVNYTAHLMSGQLMGEFTLDMGAAGAALGAAGGPTAWTASKAN